MHGFPASDTVIGEDGHIATAQSCMAVRSNGMRWSG